MVWGYFYVLMGGARFKSFAVIFAFISGNERCRKTCWVSYQTFANSHETSWDFFCPLDCTLGPCQDPGCRVLIPPMFVDWLSPKPVLLLAAQGQEVLKCSRCCVLLGWCPLWMRATLGCCRRARFLLFAACLLPLSGTVSGLFLTLCELGIFAPFVVLGGD